MHICVRMYTYIYTNFRNYKKIVEMFRVVTRHKNYKQTKWKICEKIETENDLNITSPMN